MIRASFIRIERDYRDNPGTQSPYKHNYIITDYSDLCDNFRGLDEIKAKNPDNWNTVCGGSARDTSSKQLCEEKCKRRDIKREEAKREEERKRKRVREEKERKTAWPGSLVNPNLMYDSRGCHLLAVILATHDPPSSNTIVVEMTNGRK